MALRSAREISTILTITVAAVIVWLLLTLVRVGTAFNWYAVGSSDFIGRNALAGIWGVAVMLILVGVMLALLAELTESEPTPEPWPPSE